MAEPLGKVGHWGTYAELVDNGLDHIKDLLTHRTRGFALYTDLRLSHIKRNFRHWVEVTLIEVNSSTTSDARLQEIIDRLPAIRRAFCDASKLPGPLSRADVMDFFLTSLDQCQKLEEAYYSKHLGIGLL